MNQNLGIEGSQIPRENWNFLKEFLMGSENLRPRGAHYWRDRVTIWLQIPVFSSKFQGRDSNPFLFCNSNLRPCWGANKRFFLIFAASSGSVVATRYIYISSPKFWRFKGTIHKCIFRNGSICHWDSPPPILRNTWYATWNIIYLSPTSKYTDIRGFKNIIHDEE